MSLIVNTGEIAAAAGDAYGAYQGGLGTPSNQASFGAAVAAAAATLAASANGAPFLIGLGIGIAPAASVTQLVLNIANLQNAQNPADAMAAALGILGGAAGTIGGLMPPSPLKLTLTAVAVGASAAQLGIQQNSNAVTDLINNLTRDWGSLTVGGIGGGAGGSGVGGSWVDVLAGSSGSPGFEALLNTWTTDFGGAESTTSPLVLDLNGDGVQTTRLSNSFTQGVHFNLDATGLAENTAWVDAQDGLLVRDLNGDGQINSGRELFGNHTLLHNGAQAANGFEALKELDNNADGVVDANDALFASLKVWKDTNSDGVSDAGELLTLAQAGVKSFNVSYTSSDSTDANDGDAVFAQSSSFTRSNGSTGQAGSFILAQNNFSREFVPIVVRDVMQCFVQIKTPKRSMNLSIHEGIRSRTFDNQKSLFSEHIQQYRNQIR